jgi:hypothetical protein
MWHAGAARPIRGAIPEAPGLGLGVKLLLCAMATAGVLAFGYVVAGVVMYRADLAPGVR